MKKSNSELRVLRSNRLFKVGDKLAFIPAFVLNYAAVLSCSEVVLYELPPARPIP